MTSENFIERLLPKSWKNWTLKLNVYNNYSPV